MSTRDMLITPADRFNPLLTAADIMTAAPRTCSPFSTVLEAVLIFRDADCGLVPVVAQALMFFGPVLYPASALPEWVRGWLFLNPVTLIIEELRAVLFDGRPPDWPALGLYTLVALLVLLLGYALFRRLRPAFADVM